MEYVHVVFDDKKIEGLKDEGFHDRLIFDNIEMICDDNDDDSDQEIVAKDNAEKSISNNVQNSASVEVQNASSEDSQFHPSGYKVHHPSE